MKEKAEKIAIEEPKLKHKRKKPSYSNVQLVDGFQSNDIPYHPDTVDDEFQQVFFDALDHIISAIDERFNQPSSQTYSKLEELLIYAARGEKYPEGIEELEKLYMDEVDISALQSEFFLFKEFFDDKPECFDEIHYQLKTISKQERFLVPYVNSF